MKNYKVEYYHPETFEKSEVETTIPSDLVKELKNALDKMDNYLVTPTMANPEDLSIVWGVMDNENRLKYKVSISSNK